MADNASTASGAPLAGRSVVVTRAREQAGALAAALEALGAEVVLVPVIEIIDPPDVERFSSAVRDAAGYDWVVLSSANGVDRLLDQLIALGLSAEALLHVRVAAVGSATAARLRERGVQPALVPTDFRQEGLVQEFRALGGEPGARVLFLRALDGRDLLAEELRGLGYAVDLVPAYATVPAVADPSVLDRLARGVDVLTFTSPSTVRNFLAFLQANGVDAADLIARAQAASIGPVTTAALLSRGIEPAIEPDESTVPALVAAIAEFYASV